MNLTRTKPAGARWALVGTLALAGSALAQEADRSGTALTIYSTARPGAIPPDLYRPIPGEPPRHQQPIPGYAVVKQEREVEIERERDVVRFTDVAARIDPTTVSFTSLTDPDNTYVLEQNYEFDLVSTAKLMERYLDREIVIEQVQGDRLAEFRGTLLSTQGGLVLRAEDGTVQVISGYSNVRFPELPGGLITRPTLVWNVVTPQPGRHNTRVTYQTSGITWWADYNIVFAEGEDANSGVLDVGAWVSILNRSGAGYRDARLKLIAGDVHRAPEPEPPAMLPMARAARPEMMMEPGFEERPFFEYHLYTLARPTALPDNATKQLELFPVARGVPAEKVLVYYGLPPQFRTMFPTPMQDRQFGTQSNQKVDVYLRFKNDRESGMGMPLPSGRVRVSKLDPLDETLEFIGEDVIDHTPRNEEVLIQMGSAFDVVGERKQIDFKIDTKRRWMTETIEIQLRNHKEEAVKVIIKENLFRWTNWEIRDATHEFEKEDARTIHIPVTIEPGGEVTVRYTAHYTW